MARIPKTPPAAEGKQSDKVKEKREPAVAAAEQPAAVESDQGRRDSGRQQQALIAALEKMANQMQSRDEAQQAENARRARRERYRFWLSLVVVVAVAAAAYVFWGQLKAMRGQLAGLNNGLRPWIGLSHFETDPAQIASDQPFTVTYTLKNSGMTPGYAVRGWFHVDVDAADMTDPPAFPPCGDGGTECSNQFLWPDTGYAMKQAVGADDLAKIAIPVNDRDQRLYLLGRVDYQDWQHNPHWTNICLYYDPAQKSVTACDKWNDTDQPPPGGH